MSLPANPRPPARSGESRETLQFPSPWVVKPDSEIAPLRVGIPVLALQQKTANLPGDDVQVTDKPFYLRLDLRRSGLAGMVLPRPVLKGDRQAGVSDDWLTVSDSLKRSIPARSGPVKVTISSEKAFRWYRFCRSLGSLFGAVASIISALLVALGTAGLGRAISQGLLIAGCALAFLAAVAVVVSAWRAPIG